MNERSRFAIEVGLAVMLTCLAVCAGDVAGKERGKRKS